jgi:hypothetical protein
VTNELAYNSKVSFNKVECFIVEESGVNVMKILHVTDDAEIQVKSFSLARFSVKFAICE